MTRGQFITILARAFQGSGSVGAKFSDVSDSDWFASAVYWGAENGIVNGTTDTTFSPNAIITREQVAAMIYRAIQNLHLELADSA